MGRENLLTWIKTMYKNLVITPEDKKYIKQVWKNKVVFLPPGEYQFLLGDYDWTRLKIYLDDKGMFKSLSVF